MLYAMIALLMSAIWIPMSAIWIPLFACLRRHLVMLKDATASNYFAGEVIRPAIGAAGYIVAAAAGWLIQPIAGVAIFVLIVIYCAVTSTGIRAHSLQTRWPESGS